MGMSENLFRTTARHLFEKQAISNRDYQTVNQPEEPSGLRNLDSEIRTAYANIPSALVSTKKFNSLRPNIQNNFTSFANIKNSHLQRVQCTLRTYCVVHTVYHFKPNRATRLQWSLIGQLDAVWSNRFRRPPKRASARSSLVCCYLQRLATFKIMFTLETCRNSSALLLNRITTAGRVKIARL